MTLSAPRTEPAAPFTSRHIGTSTTEQQQMLQVLGYSDLDALMADAIPGQILDETAPVLPEAAGEAQVLAELRTIAAKNTVRTRSEERRVGRGCRYRRWACECLHKRYART